MDREAEVHQMLKTLFSQSGSRLGARRVVLFGSRAQNRARPRSDFDIAVVGDTPLPLADFYALADQLDALPTLYRFDWVDLARTSEKFRQSALKQVKVIHET